MQKFLYLLLISSLLFSCKTKVETEKSEQIIPPPPPVSRSNDNTKYLSLPDLESYVRSSAKIVPAKTAGSPFDKLDYNKVIAYDFEGEEESSPHIIDRQGKFVPVILRQQALTQSQAEKIVAALTDKSTYGEGTSACFMPHFGLLFYKDDKMVNQVSVCLDCNYLLSTMEIPAMTEKKMNKGKENEIALIGFSEKGQQFIKDLCKELNFYYKRFGNRNKK